MKVNIPGFDTRMSGRLRDFCPPEIMNQNLKKKDKVLLTLRIETETSYTTSILENLSVKGRVVYDELFLFNALPDEVIHQIVMGVDAIIDLIHLKTACLRIFRFIEQPKILKELVYKFKNYIQESGFGSPANFGCEMPQTFQEFLTWYAKETFDSPRCNDYHDFERYFNVYSTTNFTEKLPFLFEKYIQYRTPSQVEREFNRCTQNAKIYIINNIRSNEIAQSYFNIMLLCKDTKIREIEEKFFYGFLYNKARDGYDMATIFSVLNHYDVPDRITELLEIARKMKAQIWRVFDDLKFIENAGISRHKKGTRRIYNWVKNPENNQVITTRVIGVGMIFDEFYNVEKLLPKVQKTPENRKRILQCVYILLEKNDHVIKPYVKWLDTNWK